jgi:DNA ligase D
MATPALELTVDGPDGPREIRVSNPDKVYFSALPEGTGRKIDLVEYYRSVGPAIVRALYDRPCVLKRHPEGAEGEAIYQKRVPPKHPEWLTTATVSFPSGRTAEELRVTELAAVLWAANLGTLDFHPWPSRWPDVEHPDELRIDLDPMPGVTWQQVQQVAHAAHELLDGLGMPSWVKTSGSKGLHVYVRLLPGSTFLECRRAVLALGRELELQHPNLCTAAWWREQRGQRVFIDYNRMARDQTIASAYSVRARPDATVSTPLRWEEVDDARITDFTILTVPQRFAEIGDPWEGMDDAAVSLEPLLELMARHERDHGWTDAPFPPQFPKMPGEPKRVQPSRARS